jgi:hypothetical protein
MTEPTPITSFRDIPKALLRNNLLRILVSLAVVVEIYNVAVITSYTATQKARATTAVAQNTVMRQKAEADLAAAKAITETEVARYAKQRQAAEARRATALAFKTKYEAEVANASASYAATKAKAEADAQEAQAELVNQQEQIQTQLNSYVERRKYAEAEIAEAKAWILQKSTGMGSRSAAAIARECNDKFEALWGDYKMMMQNARYKWEVERVAAKIQLDKARCGFTREQIRRFRRARQEHLADFEKAYCQTSTSYQQANRRDVAKTLGHRPDCRKYGSVSGRSENQHVTFSSSTQGGVTFRVISDASDGKLNLRDGPGIRHAVLAEMPVGAVLRKIGACVHSDDGVTHDPWCKVDWNGTKGWASSSGLKKVR